MITHFNLILWGRRIGFWEWFGIDLRSHNLSFVPHSHTIVMDINIINIINWDVWVTTLNMLPKQATLSENTMIVLISFSIKNNNGWHK
jgi:hypothetical protein